MSEARTVGARLLRMGASAVGRSPNFTIYDEDDTLSVVKRAMDRHSISKKTWLRVFISKIARESILTARACR